MTLLTAPAKLTLSLAVTGVRSDGFHFIDAEMVSLGIADHISISPATNILLSVDGPFADGVPTNDANLLHRALTMLRTTAHVNITKNIPHGGGLGGGSTDAAAILRWGNMSDPIAAAALGADVAFCLLGGHARVTGIGEIIEPLPPISMDITLFIPPVRVSTPEVYKQWDLMGGPRSDHGNDLEPAAVAAYPELEVWRDHIAQVTGIRPQLAGSGATWFVRGHAEARGLSSDVHKVCTTTQPSEGCAQQTKS